MTDPLVDRQRLFGRGRLRLGVAARVLAGLTAIALIALGLGALVLRGIETLGVRLDGLVGPAFTRLTTVIAIDRQGALLAAQVQALAIVPANRRESAAARLADELTMLNLSLDQLDQVVPRPGDFGGLEAVRGARDALTRTIEEMTALLDTRDAVERSVQVGYRALVAVERRLAGLMVPDESPRADAAALDAWRRAMHRQIQQGLNAFAVSHPAPLRAMARQIAPLNDLAATRLEALPAAMRVEAATIHDQVRALLDPADGVIARRRRLFALSARIEGLLEQALLHSGHLRTAATGLSFGTRQRFLELANDARAMVAAFGAQLPIAGALIILIAAGIAFGLHRGVIRRLTTLSQSMSGTTVGRPERIPITGADEITEIARTFRRFVTMVGDREAALQEARDIAEARAAALDALAAKLDAARREADDANRAKSRFLSSMSHELRTPLNAVLGFAELLLSEPRARLSAQQREFIELIQTSGEHLLQLITEVLDLARIEAGGLTLEIEPIPLTGLVTESVRMVQPLAVARGIRIENRCDDTADLHLYADPLRARQVLINLLTNGVKYNRPSGAVTIACAPGDADTWRISVIDTGPGIPADRHRDVFTPFSRLGAEATEIEGTGIGLSISRELMTRMGGAIGFSSRLGQGSTFWVAFPSAPGPSAVSPAAIAGLKGRTLLYVEDDIANLRLMEGILKRVPGITLTTAPTGALGLDSARRRRPDLIVLDINLPDLSGFEVLARLRENPATMTIPAIALSADAVPATIERAYAAGFAAHLIKPVDLDDLVAEVNRALGSPDVDDRASVA